MNSVVCESRVRIQSLIVLVIVLVMVAGRAQSPNAWRIEDSSDVTGSTLTYYATLTDTQLEEAFRKGWRLTATARLAEKYGSSPPAMYLLVGSGTVRYGLKLYGNLGVLPIEGSPPSIPLGSRNTNYHRHVLEYNPVNTRVKYFYDDLLAGEWLGQASSAQSHQVSWGSSSSAGKGEMLLHQVSFEILGGKVVASYNAGFEGNLPVAPNPVTQGWKRAAGSIPLGEGPVSPDTNPLPFVAALSPADLRRASAWMRAHLQPDGFPATYYFEYGPTAAYGARSPVSTVPENVFGLTISNLVTGLVPGTTYHYRIVLSNAVAQVASEDVAFTPPDFVLTSGTQFPSGFLVSGVAWGDYDSDGWLDLLLTGTPRPTSGNAASGLWRNNRNGTLSEVTSRLTPSLPVASGAGAWSDYDNDERLDIGISGSASAVLLHQEPDRTFSTAATFSGLNGSPLPRSWLAWGDADNDGRLDLLAMNSTETLPQLWLNTSSGFTSSSNAGLPALSGPAAWVDYDNDGRLDLLMRGFGMTNGRRTDEASQLWRNEGSLGFSDVTSQVAPGLREVGGVAQSWGDYDNDGWLDFLLMAYPVYEDGGGTAAGAVQIWHNHRGTFSDVSAVAAPELPKLINGSIAWGDYDNDGNLDFVVAGSIQFNTGVSQIWHNNGDGTFSNVTATVAPELPQPKGQGIWEPATAWADFDQDGRLDLLLAGNTSSPVAYYGLWRNESDRSNTAPTAPSDLAAAASSRTVLLTWAPASDSQTPAAGLSYNVRIGTSPMAGDVLSAQAREDGRRLLPAIGNAQMRTNLLIEALAPGTYYWSAQAIDTAFAGGPFAPERTFTVGSSPSGSPQLADVTISQDGRFWFSFAGKAAGSFTVLSTTNVSSPLNDWTVLGPAFEVAEGRFAFTNTVGSTSPTRFYQVRNP